MVTILLIGYTPLIHSVIYPYVDNGRQQIRKGTQVEDPLCEVVYELWSSTPPFIKSYGKVLQRAFESHIGVEERGGSIFHVLVRCVL